MQRTSLVLVLSCWFGPPLDLLETANGPPSHATNIHRNGGIIAYVSDLQ